MLTTFFWTVVMTLFVVLLSRYVSKEEKRISIENKFEHLYKNVNQLHLFTGEKTSYENRVYHVQDVLCKECPKLSGTIKEMAFRKISEYNIKNSK